MNILYERFPESVAVNGKDYPVVTDFREWIRFSELVEDETVPWQIKCRLLLQWYTEQIPEDIESAVYALGDFLMCRKDNDQETEEKKGRIKPVFRSQKMPAVFMQHSGKRMALTCRVWTICTGGNSVICLIGCRTIQRSSSGSCIVAWIHGQ